MSLGEVSIIVDWVEDGKSVVARAILQHFSHIELWEQVE